MSQLAVYRNPRRSAEHAPFLVEVQSDLAQTQLRVIVPLVNPDYFGPPARTLNPVVRIEGASYVLSPAEIGSLPRKQLGSAVADLRESRQEIMAALDFLLNGF
jgi:toxin CcdB